MSLHWHWGPWKIVSANEKPNLKETNGIIDTDEKKADVFSWSMVQSMWLDGDIIPLCMF